jgi:hypothetical protein
MAAACLRENHWQVHHLACDLPTSEIGTLAVAVAANLIVLSTATTAGALRADKARRQLCEFIPGIRVLIGRADDTLDQLRNRASAASAPRPVA